MAIHTYFNLWPLTALKPSWPFNWLSLHVKRKQTLQIRFSHHCHLEDWSAPIVFALQQVSHLATLIRTQQADWMEDLFGKYPLSGFWVSEVHLWVHAPSKQQHHHRQQGRDDWTPSALDVSINEHKQANELLSSVPELLRSLLSTAEGEWKWGKREKQAGRERKDGKNRK